MAPLLSSFQQVRGAKNNPQAQGKKNKEKTTKKGKKGPKEFRQRDLKDVEQFALCDAVR
jgi:large subunit ribosomal protein L1